MRPRCDDPRVERIVEFFERLAPADVARLGTIYAAGVRFKDPFNDVEGIAEVQRVFTHMFKALGGPRFVVHEALCQGDGCFLTWDFVFHWRRSNAGRQVVRGVSHLELGSQGLIVRHRDYWDAAEELYEKLPVLGALMRWLKRRVAG